MVHHDATENVIFAHFKGALGIDDTSDAMARIVAITAETGANHVLADATAVTKTQGIGAIYGFVVKNTANARAASLKIALIPSDATRSDYAFLETAARNRGWRIQLFKTRDEAMTWLKNR
jgi:hypothetical protein